MANRSEVRAETGEVPYRTVLTNGRSTFIADERKDLGGADEGATPNELMCMSLAACTSITLKMYAARKNWDTGTITVEVAMHHHEGETIFMRKISLAVDQTAEINERILAVANKCPIHKTLSAANKIESNIV
ncbi:MAG: OsmC family protein [Chitinophagales bacterium]